MRVLRLRIIFSGTFLLLFPASILADHHRVLEEIDRSLTNIALTAAVAIISFLLLILVRNKYLGYLNLICGIALIILGTGKISRLLLTEFVAEGYIFAGFLQLALSVIFGWIYHKHPWTVKDGTFSPPD